MVNMKNIIKIFSVLIVVHIIMLTGCIDYKEQDNSEDKIIGSGVITAVQRNFKDFTMLNLYSVFEATIIKSDNYSIVLKIDDNIEEYLIVEKIDDTLKIELQPNKTYYNITKEATIGIPDIEALTIDGVTKANLSGFNLSHEVKFDINGASVLTGNLNTGHLHLILDGASTITLSGKGTTADIFMHGTSTADLGDFKINRASVNIDDICTAILNVNGTINGSIKDFSTLNYFGNPILDIVSDEYSTIERLG
jgi:hypothetical protein